MICDRIEGSSSIAIRKVRSRQIQRSASARGIRKSNRRRGIIKLRDRERVKEGRAKRERERERNLEDEGMKEKGRGIRAIFLAPRRKFTAPGIDPASLFRLRNKHPRAYTRPARYIPYREMGRERYMPICKYIR